MRYLIVFFLLSTYLFAIEETLSFRIDRGRVRREVSQLQSKNEGRILVFSVNFSSKKESQTILINATNLDTGAEVSRQSNSNEILRGGRSKSIHSTLFNDFFSRKFGKRKYAHVFLEEMDGVKELVGS